jgi:anti-anti-sigma factor
MNGSRISTGTVGHNTVLTVKEALTYKNCDELENLFNQLTKENKNRIVIDFRAIPFMDSQALELLVTMHDSLACSGGMLKVFGLNATCRDILIATRLINLFRVYTEMHEALRGEA